MTRKPPTPEELILTMLRDVLARQAEQMGLVATPPPVAPPPPLPEATTPSTSPVSSPPVSSPQVIEPVTKPLPEDLAEQRTSLRPAESLTAAVKAAAPTVKPANEFEAAEDQLTKKELLDLAELNELAARPPTASNLPRTLRWLTIGLAIVLILVNLPLLSGLAIVRATPQQQALVLYEGLLIKGRGPSVYVIDGGAKRLISSEDAFWHRGYRWSRVTVIADDTLRQIPNGPPIHVILKCADSPNLYRLESDRKRFITDWEAVKAEGYTEADIRTVSCARLRSFLDGPTIP